MQDYIFNSRRQASRRRRRMILRLLLLVAGIAAGVVLATRYWGSSDLASGDSTPAESEPDRLPLPPVDQTRPLSDTRPTAPAPAPPAEKAPPAPAPAAVAIQPKPAPSPQPPAATEPEVDNAQPASPPLQWTERPIRKGDTLAHIFKEQGLPPALLHRLVHSSDTAAGLARIRPGQTLRLARNAQGELERLELIRNRVSRLEIERTDDGFHAEEHNRPVEHRQASVSGHIIDSLFVDGRKAGLSDAQIMELANLFGWDIDFALELQKGDRFEVVYDELWVDGEKLRNGPILAAEFINRGKVYRAVRYTDRQGETHYYSPDGYAKKRAFIRTPVKFTRISSRFTRKRWHPVLKRWRSHKGVDYAAPEGTPVKATGNGRVSFIGRKGGYGNVIFLRHGGRYTTVYGHLRGFARGLRTGSKVKQGQVIGYVGHTGLATGPHLHYEFRVNGVHRNPLTVKLPRSLRLPQKEMSRFLRQAQPLLARLDELRATSMVATADAR